MRLYWDKYSRSYISSNNISVLVIDQELHPLLHLLTKKNPEVEVEMFTVFLTYRCIHFWNSLESQRDLTTTLVRKLLTNVNKHNNNT